MEHLKVCSLACKHQTRQERHARDKRSSLLWKVVTYERIKFYNIGTLRQEADMQRPSHPCPNFRKVKASNPAHSVTRLKATKKVFFPTVSVRRQVPRDGLPPRRRLLRLVQVDAVDGRRQSRTRRRRRILASEWRRSFGQGTNDRFFFFLSLKVQKWLPYFIEYSVHTSIVRTLILQFSAHYLVSLKPFLGYLPSIVHRQYFITIFFEKSSHYT